MPFKYLPFIVLRLNRINQKRTKFGTISLYDTAYLLGYKRFKEYVRIAYMLGLVLKISNDV